MLLSGAVLSRARRHGSRAYHSGSAAQTAKTLGIALGRIVTVVETPNGTMWGSAYFPQVANEAVSRPGNGTLGGALQSLTLDVTLGFELAKQA